MLLSLPQQEYQVFRYDTVRIDNYGCIELDSNPPELSGDAAELLFQVVSDCYERKSLIKTSNLEFSQWNTVFGDNWMTAALVDRLIHHSHILVFTGESFRLSQSMQNLKIKSNDYQ